MFTTILDPAMLYLLMVSQSTNKEMEQIDKILSKAPC